MEMVLSFTVYGQSNARDLATQRRSDIPTAVQYPAMKSICLLCGPLRGVGLKFTLIILIIRIVISGNRKWRQSSQVVGKRESPNQQDGRITLTSILTRADGNHL